MFGMIEMELKKNKIRKFKKPTILLNQIDFDNLKTYVVENKIKLSEVLSTPIYPSHLVKKGEVKIYDDYLDSWVVNL
jgi:hypothetical protein